MSMRMLPTNSLRQHTKRLAAFALSLVFTISALPALAQQQQQQAAPNIPGPLYGYGHMWGGPGGWHGGWGWHPFMIVGPILVVLAIIAS